MIPKIIHQVWYGKVSAIPEQHLKWAEDTRTMNPTWQYRFHVPDRDAGLERRFFSPASITNYLRLKLIQAYGGVYLDLDVEPLNPLDPLCEHAAFAAEQDPGRLCNAVFGAEPHHPWINWQVEKLAMDWDAHDAAWGVYTMSAAPLEDVAILPAHLIYPFGYDTPPDQRKPHPESLVAHHWAGSWARC